MIASRILGASLLLLLPALAQAQIQTIEVSHTYMMGDNDSRNDARQLCFLEAKRKVLEKAGSYIESQTEVSMSKLSRDQIRSYSAAVLSVEIVKEEFAFENGRNALTLAVKADVDTANVKQRFEAIAKDKELQTRLALQQKEIASLEERIALLRRQLAEPRTQEQVLALRKESAAAFESISEVIKSARERIARGNEGRKAMCARLFKGMTRGEVSAVLGQPTGGPVYGPRYGSEKRITIFFNEDTGEADRFYGCEVNETGDYLAEKKRQQEKMDAEFQKIMNTPIKPVLVP